MFSLVWITILQKSCVSKILIFLLSKISSCINNYGYDIVLIRCCNVCFFLAVGPKLNLDHLCAVQTKPNLSTYKRVSRTLKVITSHSPPPPLNPSVYDGWTPLIVPMLMFVNLLTSPLRGSRDNATRRFTALQIRPLAPKTNLLVPKGKWVGSQPFVCQHSDIPRSLPKTQTALAHVSVALRKLKSYISFGSLSASTRL